MVDELFWGSRPVKHRKPVIATYILIAINTIIYLISSFQNMFASIANEWVDAYAYIPILMYNPTQWYRILTSMFIHGDIFHVFFNMLFLYWFGKELELVLGIKKILILYLVSGVSAVLFHTGFTPIIGSLNLVIPALGASGAISGLLGSYLLLYPRRRLSICWFFYFIPICFTTLAGVFLLFWFATQVIYGYLRFGGIAFFAHAGGFIAGMTLIYVLKKRKQLLETFYGIITPYEFRRPEGLGSVLKVALSILLMAVLGGVLYSIVTAYQVANVYIVDVVACMASTCYKDQGVYTPIRNEYIAPTQDLARIAFNRLVWAGVFTFIPGYNGTIVVPPRNIVAPDYNRRIYVAISGIGEYDENGILIKFNGGIETQVIYIDMFGRARVSEERIRIDNVTLTSRDVAKDADKLIIRPFALLSLLLTLSSMLIVAFKDHEIVEEEITYLPPYIPWI